MHVPADRLPPPPPGPEPLRPGDFYEEAGRVVFTAQYLLRRGTCCESGCRHCPYGFRAPPQMAPQA